ncbi:hypothetical protein ES708_17007 [subsurface metagenome]
MYNFCTLFDSFYLSRGLLMYESLKKNMDNFHLYIFAFDDLCYDILEKLKPEKTTIISLKEFENEDLLNVKNDRTKAEYCWTATPSSIYYIMTKYKVVNCTYIDADLMFFASPEVLINELKKHESVLITEHRYSKLAKWYEKKRAGRFCVQFVTFKNNKAGMKVLEKWKGQCIDWCYDRYEDGKFGDQKYLDDWPENYDNVHILKHLGGGVAPWNIQQYKIKKEGNSYICTHIKTRQKFNMVFYHFQYVKLLDNGYIDIGWHNLSKVVVKNLYLPYLKRILKIEGKLKEVNPNYRTHYSGFKPESFKDLLKVLFKKITKFNLIKSRKNLKWHIL